MKFALDLFVLPVNASLISDAVTQPVQLHKEAAKLDAKLYGAERRKQSKWAQEQTRQRCLCSLALRAVTLDPKMATGKRS